MIQQLINGITYFMNLTNITSQWMFDSFQLSSALALLMLVYGLFGYKLYRVVFSVIALFATIFGVVWLFADRYDWLYVATSFSIASVAVAFVVFFLKRLSAFFMIALIVFAYALALNIPWVYSMMLGIILGVGGYIYPFVFIVLSSAWLGAYEGAYLLRQTPLANLQIGFILLIFIVGIVVQVFTNPIPFNQVIKNWGRQDG